MSFGLDLAQKGLSLYTIPFALLSIMGAHGYASALAGKSYDPATPRQLQSVLASDEKMDKIVKARIQRAQAAAQNGFESLGLYAAGVVAANVAGVDPRSVNLISFGYIGCRVLYNIIYIRLQDNRAWAPIRSLVWTTSIGLIFTSYIMAARQWAA
ncbi:hypothetical protein CkaCkLH20_06936 [Colletotrichum karsti]|uniref:MAPEG family protein n=1 Tax=Colletotrichum karsti TaxID=1095194 RepID=A0A9P6I493_9PEZI|nr:uncharacterized protein CkaCkLH20_06936 [Colletotrichum karsti]KAF9875555.1 hypothetical protein CkaCkLH20_06936 [Colletotrichum karsti]